MIVGLDIFSKHFDDYKDQYVLIGGTAVVLSMEEAGLSARTTRDLDIVLCLEALTPGFGIAFWKFVEDGQYDVKERSDENRAFYRFKNPKFPEYPAMLEIFSRKPEALVIPEGCHLTPIPIGQEVGSLSAILLDDDYYNFLHKRKDVVGDIPVVDHVGLIGLKAYAWINLTADRMAGKKIDQRNIKKHRNDIFRLSGLISEDPVPDVPQKIRNNVDKFFNQVERDVNLADLGLSGVTVDQIEVDVRRLFGISKF